MFAEKTRGLVQQAVDEEIVNAMKYPLYRNENEFLGVVYEEYDELDEEFEAMKNNLNSFRKSIRHKDTFEILKYADLIKQRAWNLALETLQVIAVCEKGRKSFEGGKNENN